MTLPALAELRALAPGATIDLVVGSWNRELAAAIPASIASRRSTPRGWRATAAASDVAGARSRARARWRRGATISRSTSSPTSGATSRWRRRRAAWTAGFASGGGGAAARRRARLRPAAHTIDNARRLVHAVFGGGPRRPPVDAGRSAVPDAATRAARRPGSLGRRSRRAAARRACTSSGGRAIKQWPETRFREVAGRLVRDRSARRSC